MHSSKIALYFSSWPIVDVGCFDSLHGRLVHVNFNTVKRRMMHLNLISKSHINNKKKYKICVQAKQCRKAFNLIEKKTNLLVLIHNNTYNNNNILTHGG